MKERKNLTNIRDHADGDTFIKAALLALGPRQFVYDAIFLEITRVLHLLLDSPTEKSLQYKPILK